MVEIVESSSAKQTIRSRRRRDQMLPSPQTRHPRAYDLEDCSVLRGSDRSLVASLRAVLCSRLCISQGSGRGSCGAEGKYRNIHALVKNLLISERPAHDFPTPPCKTPLNKPSSPLHQIKTCASQISCRLMFEGHRRDRACDVGGKGSSCGRWSVGIS